MVTKETIKDKDRVINNMTIKQLDTQPKKRQNNGE